MKTYKKYFAIMLVGALMLAMCLPAMAAVYDDVPDGTWYSAGAESLFERGIMNGTAGGKMLVVYFSRAGENYNVGRITEGNTAKLAKEIAAQTGADLFEIVPETAYPEGYDDMLAVATDERKNNARPKIKTHIDNFESYDTVFIGYPI